MTGVHSNAKADAVTSNTSTTNTTSWKPPHRKHQQKLSTSKLWATQEQNRQRVQQQRRRRLRESVCCDVMGPSPLDVAFHRGTPLPPPPDPTVDASNNNNERPSTPWHWSAEIGKDFKSSTSSSPVVHPPSRSELVLVVRINPRWWRPAAVLRQCEYVEPATPDVLNYEYERKQRQKQKQAATSQSSVPRHNLFAAYNKNSPPRHVLFANTSDSPTPYYPHTVVGELATDAGESRQWLPQSIPYDPDEFILNDLEIELAWLGEESWHCMGNRQEQRQKQHNHAIDTHPFQWDYIWEYASPALRIELRRIDHFEDDTSLVQTQEGQEAEKPAARTDSSDKNNDELSNNGAGSMFKLKHLLRWKDPVVRVRFQVVRQWVRQQLNRGYRRHVMKRVIAQLRMRNNRGQKQTSFPEPEWHLVQQDVAFWKNHAPATNGTTRRGTPSPSRAACW